jgi:hypothetical protein
MMAYKVIQWATGSMGKSCLRATIDHPDLDLVGLLVYSESKAGRDAGEIARRDPTGVIATRSVDDIMATEADVVIHAPRIQPPYSYHNKDICRILASGKNVISINGHSFPQHWGPAYIKDFQTACAKGGATLFGTGLNPGFLTEKIATVATGICTRIDNIYVGEIFDCSTVPDANYVFDILGFGADPARLDLNDASWAPAELMTSMYTEVVAQLVDRLGLQLDHVEPDHFVQPASDDLLVSAGVIKKGTVAVTNWRWHGIVDGKRFVTLSISWIMEDTWLEDKNYNHWEVKIRGLPGIDISMNLIEPENTEFKTKAEQYAVAGSVINSIPAVCAAAPGVMQIPVFAPYRPRFTE